MKAILWMTRIIVGVLFIFSGLIKANDPLGLSYKMEEFFEVLHLTFLHPFALTFSVVMIAFEIIAGVALLLGYAFRTFSYLLLLLIIFFTFLTGFALFSGKVKECGCFGDCIKLTAKESFIKDLILLILIGFLFAFRNKIKPLLPKKLNSVLMVIFVIFSFGIQFYVLKNLPVKDCLAYKVGNNLWQKMQPPPGSTPDVFETVLVYKKDGLEKEFTQENFPWEDSTWEFVDSRTKLIKKGNGTPEILDLSISDFDGNDYTEQMLTDAGRSLLLFIKNPSTASADHKSTLTQLYTDAKNKGIQFYVLTSGTKENTLKFLNELGIPDAEVYTIDGTVNKTAMRSNPGLMLLDNGFVMGKWSPNNYPGLSQLP